MVERIHHRIKFSLTSIDLIHTPLWQLWLSTHISLSYSYVYSSLYKKISFSTHSTMTNSNILVNMSAVHSSMSLFIRFSFNNIVTYCHLEFLNRIVVSNNRENNVKHYYHKKVTIAAPIITRYIDKRYLGVCGN